MLDKSTIEKLLDRSPLAVLIIGVIVFVIGAAGGLSVGNPPLQVTDPLWRIALGIMGIILVAVGLLFVARETRSASSPIITDQAQSLPVKVSEQLGKFRPLSFTGARTSCFQVPTSAYGIYKVNGIPLVILPYVENSQVTGHQVVSVGPQHDGSPGENRIPCDIPGVKRVYIVWTAGNGWKSFENVLYEGRRIGTLELAFSDGTTQQIPVTLGVNIREWIFRNPRPHGMEVVGTLSDTRVSQIWESLDGLYTLDMITIDLDNPPKDLRSVNLIGRFEIPTSIPGEALPHFQISAITCEVA